ncbi:MAG: UDP-N-acetylmuramoyl-L-alanyl-D-glutamate--2,6-diaminopimelate ligase [Bacillota bacterium]
MQFGELIGELDVRDTGGDHAAVIKGIAYDSRRVEPGFLFVAIKGFRTDGHLYIGDALARGAAGVILQERVSLPAGIPWVQVTDSRRALALVAARFFGYPSKSLNLTGVTGTNGKTTTTHMLAAIYRRRGRVGLIGTVYNLVHDRVLPGRHTTPEAVELQGLLREMVDAGVANAVMEVSSHALALSRVEGCRFGAAVFTNLTQDHLDFHPTLEAYFAAKARLFQGLPPAGLAVINCDDSWGRRLGGLATGRVVSYGLETGCDVRAVDVSVRADGVAFGVESAWGNFPVRLRLTGMFNVYNALAAVACSLAQGFSPEEVAAGLAGLQGVPGRFERIDRGQDFTVIVDYAHTPDGLINVLQAARAIAAARLIVVFGCGGDRDRKKRPLMGEAAVRYADLAIITSDNPRTEDPLAIIDDIEAGARGVPGGRYLVEPDRRRAIRAALQIARCGDVVLVAGKGHEDYQIIGEKRLPFDDRLVVAELLKETGRARK